jgi:uncharacterized membrane protein
VNRRVYIDWLRGLAVLIMIEAHALDAWTSVEERAHAGYRWAIVLGGLGAPLFLFLAGITLALAAGARRRSKGLDASTIAGLAQRRGWQIFGLAFLFRLQSWLISGGRFPEVLFKVDILNVMGLGMVAAAAIWRVGRNDRQRAGLFVVAAVVAAMAAPVVLTSPVLASMPVPFAWYFAPVPGFSSFALLPWIGFLFAGAALGLWLDVAHKTSTDRRLAVILAGIGGGVAALGYGASLLPALYATTTFWGTSPAFFFVRLGIVVMLLALACGPAARWPGRSVMTELGAASLFVYWIHVEMVYGVIAHSIRRALSFEQALVGYLAFCGLIFALVRLKNAIVASRLGRARQPATG